MPKIQSKKEEDYQNGQKGFDPVSCAHREMGRNYIDAIIRKMLMWHTGECLLFCDVIQTLPGVYNEGYQGWLSPDCESPFDSLLMSAGKQFMHGNFQYLGQVQTWIWKFITSKYPTPGSKKQIVYKYDESNKPNNFMYKMDMKKTCKNKQQQNGSICEQEYGESITQLNYKSQYNEQIDFYLRSVACAKTQLNLFCQLMHINYPKVSRLLSSNNQWVVSAKLIIDDQKYAPYRLIFQAQVKDTQNTIAFSKMSYKMLKIMYRRLPRLWKQFRYEKKGRNIRC